MTSCDGLAVNNGDDGRLAELEREATSTNDVAELAAISRESAKIQNRLAGRADVGVELWR
ncbi:MAG: hypothetical protein ABSB33_03315 [Tepidisphaeraceae bacterium]